MLRTLTGSRRKFSFDLALHRSREKKYSGDRPSATAVLHEEDEEDEDEDDVMMSSETKASRWPPTKIRRRNESRKPLACAAAGSKA